MLLWIVFALALGTLFGFNLTNGVALPVTNEWGYDDCRSNPQKAGLVGKPEDWKWSSFRHYLTGEIGAVEIESEWTWRRRRSMGIELKMRVRENTSPTKRRLDGARA